MMNHSGCCKVNCWGAVLLVAGVLFGLQTLGIVAYDFVRFWPLLLVIKGLGRVVGHRCMMGCCSAGGSCGEGKMGGECCKK